MEKKGGKRIKKRRRRIKGEEVVKIKSFNEENVRKKRMENRDGAGGTKGVGKIK